MLDVVCVIVSRFEVLVELLLIVVGVSLVEAVLELDVSV